MKHILSLGAGVQSTTVILMSCQGLLPKLDCAIFADTQWERRATYDHLGWLEKEAGRHGIPVHRVTYANLRDDVMAWGADRQKGQQRARMPLFTTNPDGTTGIINRHCTRSYKVEPIEKFMRNEVMGLKKGQRSPRECVIEHWYGISWDERERMRTSRDPWEVYWYPLVDGPRRMTRQDCLRWLAENYPALDVPRSACIGCPFHSDAEWRNIRDNDPEAWADAIDFDDRIRRLDPALRGDCYLHPSRKPLSEVDLRTDFDKGQLPLWQDWRNECHGMCGV